MNRKQFERVILSYSMRMLNCPKRVEDTRINNVDAVSIYVVNSKFEVLYEEKDVPLVNWMERYYELYDTYKEKTDHYSRYIVVTDENNIYYCTKLKII